MIRRFDWRSMILVLLLMPLCTTGFAGSDSGPKTDPSCWFWTDTAIEDGEATIEQLTINSPPEPPVDSHRPVADLPESGADRAIIVLPVPSYTWSFGASPTAAAMIAAWYDRIAYPDIYTGPTNGGVMPLDNTVWPDWVDNNGDTIHQCPLSATHAGLDGRVERGHVDDFWDFFGQPGPDPHQGNWPEHTHGECTGDFMRSNRWMPWKNFNTDGATTFYFFANGAPLFDSQLDGVPLRYYDGGYGQKMFYESRGYTVHTMYNQYITGYNGNPVGFSFAAFMAEIDAGRPVMIHLLGHTVVGMGYDNNSGEVIYINDTWDNSTHTMVWGEDYAGLPHTGVTIVQVDLATLVELTSFTAKASADRVNLEWETASELDNAGFNLWRCETKEGEFKRINKQLIPAQGGGSWGATYQVTDDRVESGRTYFYKLEDVNLAGDSTLHGPVSARVGPPGGVTDQSGD